METNAPTSTPNKPKSAEKRVTIFVSDTEHEALVDIATREDRSLTKTAKRIFREGLIARAKQTVNK